MKADATKIAPRAPEATPPAPLIIRCPSCKSEFLVFRQFLGEDGTLTPDPTTFRCGDCGFEQHITLADLRANGRRLDRRFAGSG